MAGPAAGSTADVAAERQLLPLVRSVRAAAAARSASCCSSHSSSLEGGAGGGWGVAGAHGCRPHAATGKLLDQNRQAV